jgi:serine/threonine-protein kinase
VSIEAGKLLSHYRLVEKLGEGGMGVVWNAIDTTLDREVAIKVLPEAFAADPERLTRFDREAKLLASLNHPNIATIHGLEEEDDVRFLTMELVPGEDLAQSLARGPLSLEETLALARQIANALEAAHASGVVHRDLKPSNIRITPDGTAKVLDFGLAKTVESSAVPAGTDPALSPTRTSAGTMAGVILGTAAYMSPEQARGAQADRRADIWAFGCLVYECLTGRKAFPGETVSDTMAAVLKSEPNWEALPRETPPALRRLLHRCLEKDRERRLRSAADARIEIDDAMSEEPAPAIADGTQKRPWLPWLLAALLAVVAVAIGVAWERSARGSRGQLHVAVTLRQALELMPGLNGDLVAALSPDGSRIAFTAREEDTIHLYLRSLDSPEVVMVPGTESASSPFFSPDGKWVAFFAAGVLKKVSVMGGTPVELCDAPSGRGGSWSEDGTIVFSPLYTAGLARVPEEGGEPEIVTRPDQAQNERTHRWPDVLPGGRAAVCTIGTLDNPGYYEDATIAVVDLDSGEIRPLIEGGSFARYSRTGHLIYSRLGELLAVPFDLGRMEVTGPPAPMMDQVARASMSGAVHFAVSLEGTMMYVPATLLPLEGSMVWVDREGRAETIMYTPVPFLAPRLSPDGTKVAVGIGAGRGDGDIWIHDVARGKSTRLTFESDYVAPLWTLDGKRVVFGVTRGVSEGLAWKAVDGSEAEQMILSLDPEYVAQPEAWHPDGETLVFTRVGGRGGFDLMTAKLGDEEPRAMFDGPGREGGASFSPDGRWIVYTSNETGRFEVYIRSYPGPEGKWQISTDGGKGAVWSRDGREIFYTDGNSMLVVPVETDPTFTPGPPRELFQFEFIRDVGPWPDYDVTPDGERFVMYQRSPENPPPRSINLVTDFAALIAE